MTVELSTEQIAIIKLWAVAKHLNISDPPQPTDLLTAVALVEHAAEWARTHIEKRGAENDELREQAIKLSASQLSNPDSVYWNGYNDALDEWELRDKAIHHDGYYLDNLWVPCRETCAACRLRNAASKFGARVFERCPSWRDEQGTDFSEARDALTQALQSQP